MLKCVFVEKNTPLNVTLLSLQDIGLHNAGNYLSDKYGKAALYIWSIGLLAAGLI